MRRSKTAVAHINQTMMYIALMTLIVFAACVLMSTAAFAGSSSGIGSVLCGVVNIAQGNAGQALAMLGIIVIGIGATLGKVSWGLALTVAVGIALIFNAQSILAAIGAPSGGC